VRGPELGGGLIAVVDRDMGPGISCSKRSKSLEPHWPSRAQSSLHPYVEAPFSR